MSSIEPWLRGPIAGVPSLLQPVAHALTLVREDLPALLQSLPEDALWICPGRSACIGFHVAHLSGSLDRLFTYARGKALNDAQRVALKAERDIATRRPPRDAVITLATTQLDQALGLLQGFDESQLLLAREVGSARLPSTVIGLLVHAAEHSAQHFAQIRTLAKIVGPEH